MSNRERCAALLDSFTEAQLVNISAILQIMRRAYDDIEDEEFCKKMEAEYEADPDKGDFEPIEDFAKSLGITL